MPNRAAIRWLLKGPTNPPVIQYMLLDNKLDYLIYPKECKVTDLVTNLDEIFAEIEKKSGDESLDIYYKSINEAFGRHRRDSGQFHRRIRKLLSRKNQLKPNSRLAFVLKKDQLKLFKDALYFLDIDCKSRGNAFVAYLWAIALKATRGRLPLVINKFGRHVFLSRV